MATKRKQPAKRTAGRKPVAKRRPRKASRLMTRAEMVSALSEYTAEAIATMMKIVRSNAPHMASVRAKAVTALRKHGWAKILPRKQATARKGRKLKARKRHAL